MVPDDNAPSKPTREAKGKLPIKMMSDRILVEVEGTDGDRRSSGGILIPATAQVGKRLAWALVVATGPNVRSMELDDRVLREVGAFLADPSLTYHTGQEVCVDGGYTVF